MNCGPCRYNKCLSVGMQPSNVRIEVIINIIYLDSSVQRGRGIYSSPGRIKGVDSRVGPNIRPFSISGRIPGNEIIRIPDIENWSDIRPNTTYPELKISWISGIRPKKYTAQSLKIHSPRFPYPYPHLKI